MSASIWVIGYRAYLRAHGHNENESFEVRTGVVVDWILDRADEFDADHMEGENFASWLERKFPAAEAVAA